MTCIVGIEDNGKVWIGGDSAACAGYERVASNLSKVFQRGQFLIGYTTSFRMGQLLQYRLDVPEQEAQDDLEYMATEFVDAVRDLFKVNGFSKIASNEETGGTFLVGYRGRLYEVYEDYQVNWSRNTYQAIGSGAAYALGTLYALEHFQDLDVLAPPGCAIELALQAACKFTGSVCGPFVIKCLADEYQSGDNRRGAL